MIKTISLPRSGGKTTALIKEAAANNYYIICANLQEVDRIELQARKLKLTIPQPITYTDFDRKSYYGAGITGFLFDNVDEYLQNKTKVPIKTVSITGFAKVNNDV